MDILARVLFEVDVVVADSLFRAILEGDVQIAMPAQGLILLGDLIVFRQIGVVIILPVELGDLRDLAVQRQRGSAERDRKRAG
jgi:hypothetical protein